MGMSGSIQRIGMPQNSRLFNSQDVSQAQIQSCEGYDIYTG